MDILLFFISFIFAMMYLMMIFWIMSAWDNIEEPIINPTNRVFEKCSIIVPVRNEEIGIEACIHSILNNDFPKDAFELLIVDDHSSDQTASIVQSMTYQQVRLIKLPAGLQGKKNAITMGVSEAKHPIILCTDGDSEVSKDWIRLMEQQFKEKKSVFIAGPVFYPAKYKEVDRFQYLDGIATIGATAAGISTKKFFLSNGANMAFKKDAFHQVGGYKDNISQPSGDDVFLIQSMALFFEDKISFLKSPKAMVTTKPQKTWSDLLEQRKRWAGKSLAYKNKELSKWQMFIWFINFYITLMILLGIFYHSFLLFVGLFMILIKGSIDYLYLSRMADWYQHRLPLKSYWFQSILFSLYIQWAAYWALMKPSFKWKERRL